MSANRNALETGVAFALASVVAGLGGALIEMGPCYDGLVQPPWEPPESPFVIVWTFIFICVGFVGVIGWRKVPTHAARRELAWALAVNGVLNVGWSALFFGLRRPDWALIEIGLLWLSILVLTLMLAAYSRMAGLLMRPYLVWVGAAGLLNEAIVDLNGPFGASLAQFRAGRP